ncbi:MAG TPA: L,D-transpeptidase family protein [Sedimentisphaerales bacterium]|nr:L,D-transpeptidase family protein [Sedimentisphaerales bacterium]
MARYPAGVGNNKRWIYIFLGLLVAIVVTAFFYNPFGSDKPKKITDEQEPVVSQDQSKPKDKPQDTQAATQQPSSLPNAAQLTGNTVTTAADPNKVASVIDPIAQASAKIDEYIKTATDCMTVDPPKVIEARDRLNEILHMDINAQQGQLIRDELSKIADVWLFSKKIFPADTLCAVYKVQSGDVFQNIANQYKIPYEIIMTINGIDNPRSLRIGQALKVINGPFHAKVYLSSFRMDIYLQNTFVKSFPIGIGKPGYDTPTGMWIAKPGGKLIAPPWTDPDTGRTYESEDPDYPLGSRWVSLEGVSGAALGRTGFAIHGTKAPDEIGKAASRGCIRLHNGNAILVYNMMTPGLSQVEVIK